MSSFFVTLRGQEIKVEGSMGRAEPDVGIMSSYLDDFEIYNLDGQELDWDLTDEEVDTINDAANAAEDDDLERE